MNKRNRLAAKLALVAGLWTGVAGAGAQGPRTPTPAPRRIIVPSHVEWTSTAVRVEPGDRLHIEATGEIRLSFHPDDTATPAGTPSARRSDTSPVPGAPVGSLIGRINSGTPFAIGAAAPALAMPARGRLFLAVNDDHADDNTGNFVVTIRNP